MMNIPWLTRIGSMTLCAAVLASTVPMSSAAVSVKAEKSTISVSQQEIEDKILGGWAGQMIGVGWAGPTEFQAQGRMLTEQEVPVWKPSMANDGFWQDDVYVEIPFLQAMTDHGVDCSATTAGAYFRDTTFPLYHANAAARDNLIKGINPPNSGHYLYNDHSDDIDWQIEADFLGQIYPGQINATIERAWELGHIMNYGDGVYGGVYVAAMHAAAFTASDVREITEIGRQAIPEGSLFRTVIDEVHTYYDAGKTWQQTWQLLENEWSSTDHCIEGSRSEFNIDAKLNAAYMLMGLLYGNGDFEQTMKISMMCGQDSDCNPASAASILGNFMGFAAIPNQWKSALKRTGEKFIYTENDFNQVVEMNTALAREALVLAGGSEENGFWNIPVDSTITPPPLEQLPDMMPVSISGTKMGSAYRFIAKPYKAELVKSILWDFGDGTSASGLQALHHYEQSGLYQVKCTVTSVDDLVITKTMSYVVGDNIASLGTPIASVMPEGGGGNPSLSVICDGVLPDPTTGGANEQFDTYRWYEKPEEQWIGYTFEEEATIGMVLFQEGMHYSNGGWFSNAAPLKLQVLIDGEWVDEEYTCNPGYIQSNLLADFGSPFEKYTFTLNTPVAAKGVRLCGMAGGQGEDAGFISCAEMEVYAFSDTPTTTTTPEEDVVVTSLIEQDASKYVSQDVQNSSAQHFLDNGGLFVDNTAGMWPSVVVSLTHPVVVNMDSHIRYRLSTGKQASVVLYFNGSTPGSDDGIFAVLNPQMQGARYDTGSGDVLAGQTLSGTIALKDLVLGGYNGGTHSYPGASLSTVADADGTLTVTGLQVYAIGDNAGMVELRELSALVPTSSTTTTTTTTGPLYQVGDVNRDGITGNMMDARLLFQYVSGTATLDSEQLKLADVTGRGMSDILDARRLFQIAAGG